MDGTSELWAQFLGDKVLIQLLQANKHLAVTLVIQQAKSNIL